MPQPCPSPSSKSFIRVLVVDRHPLIRRGLAVAAGGDSGLSVIGEAADGAQALELAGSLAPDVVVLSLRLPKVDGLDVIGRLRSLQPQAKVIAMVDPGCTMQAQLAIRAGARACVYVCISREELGRLVRHVHEGAIVQDPERWGRAGHGVPTLREVDVLRCVGLGHTNRQIAADLGISLETVKAHLKTLFTRLGARDRTHAAVLGYQLGIISRAR